MQTIAKPFIKEISSPSKFTNPLKILAEDKDRKFKNISGILKRKIYRSHSKCPIFDYTECSDILFTNYKKRTIKKFGSNAQKLSK